MYDLTVIIPSRNEITTIIPFMYGIIIDKRSNIMKKGHVKSAEWIKKISDANKGKPSPKKGMIFVPLEEQKKKRQEYKKKWDSEHPDKLREYNYKGRIKNRDSINANARERYYKNRDSELARHRMKSYGIDDVTYFEMVAMQNGKCIICGDTPSVNLSVDHNHVTGKIRGLVCNSCNIAIAKAKDSPIILRAMADYLEKFDA